MCTGDRGIGYAWNGTPGNSGILLLSGVFSNVDIKPNILAKYYSQW